MKRVVASVVLVCCLCSTFSPERDVAGETLVSHNATVSIEQFKSGGIKGPVSLKVKVAVAAEKRYDHAQIYVLLQKDSLFLGKDSCQPINPVGGYEVDPALSGYYSCSCTDLRVLRDVGEASIATTTVSDSSDLAGVVFTVTVKGYQ